MSTLKELVGPGKKVHFQFYRKGELHYKTTDGFDFVVPVDDCGDAEFLNEDKAMLFMRYIRKQLEANAAAMKEAMDSMNKEIETDMARREATNELLEKTYST